LLTVRLLLCVAAGAGDAEVAERPGACGGGPCRWRPVICGGRATA